MLPRDVIKDRAIAAAFDPPFSFILRQVAMALADTGDEINPAIENHRKIPVTGMNYQDFWMGIMHSKLYGLIGGFAIAWTLYPGTGLACDPNMDGCLGCSDADLPVCVEKIAMEICSSSGGFEYCDKISAEEEIERLVIRNTGVHMSRVRALVRGANRYQHPHPH